MQLNKLSTALLVAGLTTSGAALATNGMNLEGYGPIATGMGGASMAYDNGVAAVMNNPATLSLGGQGSRLDLAVGMLGPDVTSGVPAFSMTAPSGGDAYYMPAVGYAKTDGKLTYGVAMFAQGGMGTEYAGNTFMSNGTGLPTRSELGVGRLIAPLSYQVSPELSIGGSLDFVWAMLDMQMVASADQVRGMTGGSTNISGSGANNAYLNFSDDSDFTGKAKGYGWAGKLGFTYKVSPTVTIGGTYQSETSLSDMETSSTGTAFGLYNNATHIMTDRGKLTVVDFQWPETYGLGVAFQATPSLLIAADYKRLNWSDVMNRFTMVYSSAMMGSVNMVMPQLWEDQDIFQLGVSYKATDALTLRAGINYAENPIPNATVHPLFPATVDTHYTFGFGYAFDKSSEVNFSLTYVPENSVTGTTPQMNQGVQIDHSQTSWQLMYSKKF